MEATSPSFYQVDIYCGDALLDNQLTMYQDPNVPALSITDLDVYDDGITRTLQGQNQPDDTVDLMLALYDLDGRICWMSTAAVDDLTGTVRLG